MARDTIAITNAAINLVGGAGSGGVTATIAAPVAANDGQFSNAFGRTILLFINGFGGASVQETVVTVVSVADPYSRTGDLTLTVAVDTVGVLGPFPPLLFNQSNPAGFVFVNYDAVSANARVAAIHVPGG